MLLDDVLDAHVRVGAVAAEARVGVLAAERAFGATFGRAIGPAYDAYQMADGAVKWFETGSSDAFGQAGMGVALAWLGGVIVGGAALLFGAELLAVAAFAALGAGVGSLLGPSVFDWFNQQDFGFWNSIFDEAGHLADNIGDFFTSAARFVARVLSDPRASALG